MRALIRLSGGECHKSGSDQSSPSKRALIGTKFGTKIKINMRKLWYEFRVSLIYFLFFQFSANLALQRHSRQGLLSSACKKAHGCDHCIFIFLSVYYEPILGTEAMRKALMSSEKKCVYSCQMGFDSECSLRVEWQVTTSRGRNVGSLPLHTLHVL